MNPGDPDLCGDHQTSLHQYQHSQHQLPCYTSQIAEVGSPIVSSTSNQVDSN